MKLEIRFHLYFRTARVGSESVLLVQGEVARQIEGFWIYALETELFIPAV
jgi:hypothetical protein